MKSGRYQLAFKAAGQRPQLMDAYFVSMEAVLIWLKRFHKSLSHKSPFASGQVKYYFIDKLTGEEVGSTLDLIDKEK